MLCGIGVCDVVLNENRNGVNVDTVDGRRSNNARVIIDLLHNDGERLLDEVLRAGNNGCTIARHVSNMVETGTRLRSYKISQNLQRMRSRQCRCLWL